MKRKLNILLAIISVLQQILVLNNDTYIKSK
jgi:hypothetical protein